MFNKLNMKAGLNYKTSIGITLNSKKIINCGTTQVSNSYIMTILFIDLYLMKYLSN